MNRALGIFVVCELAYIAAARVIFFGYNGSEIHKELYWTVIRLVSAILTFLIFKRVITSEKGEVGKIPPSSFLAAGIFLVPFAVGSLGLKSPTNYVFAATSFIVGIREELAYRGVLQNIFIRKFGVIGGLISANILFVLYHFGVQSFSILNVLQLFFVGLILGITYLRTGSLIFVIILHSIYDAIWCFTPILNHPLPEIIGTMIFSVTLLILLKIKKEPNKALQTTIMAVTPAASHPSRQP